MNRKTKKYERKDRVFIFKKICTIYFHIEALCHSNERIGNNFGKNVSFH